MNEVHKPDGLNWLFGAGGVFGLVLGLVIAIIQFLPSSRTSKAAADKVALEREVSEGKTQQEAADKITQRLEKEFEAMVKQRDFWHAETEKKDAMLEKQHTEILRLEREEIALKGLLMMQEIDAVHRGDKPAKNEKEQTK